MKSRTKIDLKETALKKIFDAAGIFEIESIVPLSAGEFNAVYLAATNNNEYVLKIAPRGDTPVLPQEKGMMRAEVFWYETIRKNTKIRVPEIYFSDFSGSLIDADYFIMEKLTGFHPDKNSLSPAELCDLNANMARMCAEIHKIKNDKFGFIQNELFDNWYLAIRSMTENIIKNANENGHKLKRGEKLLSYIDRCRDVLEQAECSMVNYDLWQSNIIVRRTENGLEYGWIDPERSFWGDRIADFVCLDYAHTLSKKKDSIAAYNAVAETPIKITRETQIRYAVAAAFMGLIQDAEKFYRYSPCMLGWWRNIVSCKFFYDAGFRLLEKYA